jgi:hypothetical protein
MLLIAGWHRIRICQPDRAPCTTAVAQSNLPPAVIDHVAASHLYSLQSFCCRVSVMLTLSLSWQMMIVFRKNEKHSSRFAKKAFSHLLSLEIDGRAASIPAAKRFLSVSFLLDLSRACLGNWSFLIRKWRKQALPHRASVRSLTANLHRQRPGTMSSCHGSHNAYVRRR